MPPSTLSVGGFGDEVKRLQRELRRLGFHVPDSEFERGFFGPATREAIQEYQAKHGLIASGVLDEATAAALNEALTKWGANSEAAETASGAHESGYAPSEDRSAPPAGSSGYSSEEGVGDTFLVRGRVISDENASVDGVRVRAVDKHVGGEEPLGEAVTDVAGGYAIRYGGASLRKRGKEKPDLQLKVTSSHDHTKLLAVSDVRYDAGTEETVDLVVPADRLERPVEYQRISAELAAHIGGHAAAASAIGGRFSKLQEDEERQDITYLAHKTGWDARMVAMVALADQFSAQSGVHPEFYYALFRAGLPANHDLLSRAPPKTVEALWKRTIDDRIIPPELEAEIPNDLERFKAYGTSRLLEATAMAGISSLGELLDVSLGPHDDRKQRFARVLYEKRDAQSGLWDSVRDAFGDETADRLQLDGKLGFLTINNAPLIARLHARNSDLRTPLDLVRQGFYRHEAWTELLENDLPVPPEIPGESSKEKHANYAAFMASQLRLSYPTAVIAEMVRTDAMLSLRAKPSVKKEVMDFLNSNQGRFELGIHPVEQYLRKHEVTLTGPALAEVKKLQRVFQISPSDDVMAGLLEHGLDSAWAVVRHDERTFVDSFGEALGGEGIARLTYAKAHQVHHAVLNIATAYLLDRSSPSLYVTRSSPAANRANELDTADVLAYPTLEGIFGEMDYCACEHCRSWLSPAAYLVDLLQFLDRPDSATHEREKPLDVLLGRNPDIQARRPDIQHLQLTCENTNTVLPYIDLVNEILEYFIVNNFSLQDFHGHNTNEGVTTEELLANPQFVRNEAYDVLKDAVFPVRLPFHQPLEALRRYFDRFEVPLHLAMERLAKDESPDTGLAETDYTWQDILLERLQLSRQEYAALTDSSIPLRALYGLGPDIDTEEKEEKLVNHLLNARNFARRVGITYEELIEIIRTQFINPNGRLLPKLEKLGVGFVTVKAFLDGKLSEDAFVLLLSDDLDWAAYGGDVPQWVRDHADQILGLIVLSNPTGGQDVCSFDALELRYASPDFDNNRLKAVEFLKLIRFIRLWRKLGWSIESTDRAFAALYPSTGTLPKELDDGFKVLVSNLAGVERVMERLELETKRDLAKLLALWAPIDTHGHASLYRQMFLNPTILRLDEVFLEDGYGNYLAEKREYQLPGAKHPKLLAHAEALRAAFSLTQEEFDLVLRELGFDADTVLDLANVSAVFRYGYLARHLKLSVRELHALKNVSGIDPFGPLLPMRPDILRFIDLVQLIERSGFKIGQLLYFLQHDDLGGNASPSRDSVLAFARTLRTDLIRIDQEHRVEDDPTGDVAQARMALVYGHEVTGTFFGLLNGSPPKDFQAFFDRFPDLEGLYDAYQASTEPKEDKRRVLLETFLPVVRRKLKQQHVLQAVSAGVDTEPSMVGLLLETPTLLHAVSGSGAGAIEDFLNLDTQGASVRFFFDGDVTAMPDFEATAIAGIDYDAAKPPTDSAAPESTASEWHWYLEVPDNGSYDFYVEADDGAKVSLTIEGKPVALDVQEGVWRSGEAIELKAGRLYEMQLSARNVNEELLLKWGSVGVAREAIPAAYLYPAVLVDRFAATYLRLLKVLAMGQELALSAAEIRHFGTHPDYFVDDEGWLNALPVVPSFDTRRTPRLLSAFADLLRYAELRKELKIRDDSLIPVFEVPEPITEDWRRLLGQATGWDDVSLNVFYGRFGLSPVDLSDLAAFLRIKEAFDLTRKLGIGAAALVASTTNDPTPETIRDLQGALRARYDESGWLTILQPINDELRRQQREALVAFALHKLRESVKTAHIDTPDKLFEYFLIDVEMDPCMQTSRVKQAISSVQLFIQRCLMNLEDDVAPSSINARQWEWMKRYRVWEVNRKVFLFPENWLEPELRGDKSPFFKELESDLLQSDITDDAAATALVHYLEKLDEVAMLEICGMDREQASDTSNEVLHVIGRTSGARRNCYYRRQEASYWTPWEKVDLNIEDNPVLPVVWRGRLLLFWLTVLQEVSADQTVPAGNAPDDALITQLTVGHLSGDTRVVVKVALYWSEYYNGKWQPPRTSNVSAPIELGRFEPAAFNRANLLLKSSVSHDELTVIVGYDSYESPTTFTLYNTHSLPLVNHWDPDSHHYAIYFAVAQSSLVITYIDYDPESDKTTVLAATEVFAPVTPFQMAMSGHSVSLSNAGVFIYHGLSRHDILEQPFFFQDGRHVFYVRALASAIPWPTFAGGWFPSSLSVERTLPRLLIRTDRAHFILPGRNIAASGTTCRGAGDLGVDQFLNIQDAQIRRALCNDYAFSYHSRRIGPGGSITPVSPQRRRRSQTGNANPLKR